MIHETVEKDRVYIAILVTAILTGHAERPQGSIDNGDC